MSHIMCHFFVFFSVVELFGGGLSSTRLPRLVLNYKTNWSKPIANTSKETLLPTIMQVKINNFFEANTWSQLFYLEVFIPPRKSWSPYPLNCWTVPHPLICPKGINHYQFVYDVPDPYTFSGVRGTMFPTPSPQFAQVFIILPWPWLLCIILAWNHNVLTLLPCITLPWTKLHYTILPWTILLYTKRPCYKQYFTVLHCTILPCSKLYFFFVIPCTILKQMPSNKFLLL